MPSSSPPPMPERRYLRVLSIAGSDSGGGAGIQADLKTFSAMGCYGMTALTALTAQNTQGVQAIHAVPLPFLREQIDSVLGDIGADAVKIGMLHAPPVVEVVAEAIDRHGLQQVVLDPVMVAASGDRLVTEDTVRALTQWLFPRVRLITPNLDEAALLLGRPLTRREDLMPAARDLLTLGAPAVLLKGGHLAGDTVVDVFVDAQGAVEVHESPRIATRNLHGAGCTLSSAVACRLAMGDTMRDAVAQARAYLRAALEAGADVRTGHGHGPLNHGHAPQAMQVRG